MKKIRSVAPVSIAVSFGAVALACGSFSSSGGSTGSSSGMGTSSGSSVSGDNTGTAGAASGSGSGGSSGTAVTSGSSGTSVTSGSSGTADTSGSSGTAVTGSSGTAVTGSSGTAVTSGSSGTAVTGSSGTAVTGSSGTAVTGSSGTAVTGSSGTAGTSGSSSGTMPVASGPCDILAAAGNKCAAAHSTVRALFSAYTGPLYQVCKGASVAGPNSCPGGVTMDIGVVGGVANSAAQDTFCAGGATCTISIIYDQSPNKNDLKPAPAGGAKPTPDLPATATDLKTTINGHAVYGLLIKPGIGYRKLVGIGTATGDQPETMYMVTSMNKLVDGCCFDYGNAETDSHDDGNGTMEAVYFGGGVIWGTGTPGGTTIAQRDANGPWLMADLENGLYAGWENNQDRSISTNTPLKLNFVTGVVVGDTAAQNAGKGRFAVYGGDATTGALKTLYDGIRPAKPGYVPMLKQGSIILGIGGDNSDSDGGEWFEGIMASGAATLGTVNAVQANIVAAGYGK